MSADDDDNDWVPARRKGKRSRPQPQQQQQHPAILSTSALPELAAVLARGGLPALCGIILGYPVVYVAHHTPIPVHLVPHSQPHATATATLHRPVALWKDLCACTLSQCA